MDPPPNDPRRNRSMYPHGPYGLSVPEMHHHQMMQEEAWRDQREQDAADRAAHERKVNLLLLLR